MFKIRLLTVQAVNTVNTVIIDVVKRRDEGGQEEGCQHEAGRQPSASNHGCGGRGLWAGQLGCRRGLGRSGGAAEAEAKVEAATEKRKIK